MQCYICDVRQLFSSVDYTGVVWVVDICDEDVVNLHKVEVVFSQYHDVLWHFLLIESSARSSVSSFLIVLLSC